jgi:hypothetical protein
VPFFTRIVSQTVSSGSAEDFWKKSDKSLAILRYSLVEVDRLGE